MINVIFNNYKQEVLSWHVLAEKTLFHYLKKARYTVRQLVRLSVAKPTEQNDSVENQKTIIKEFICTRSDIELTKIYIDENTTGSTFERKAFEEMLDDIDSGKIDCVVTKDLSRFGRNAIEVTFYVQHFFPQKGIRFISIMDRFDTLDGITDISFDKTSSMRIPLLNVFNEEYSADIKRKTQASIDTNIRKGKFVSSKAPYGYAKSPDDCHKLIVDPEAAAVVKDIFNMAEQNISLNEIVRRLNLAHIPTPIDYATSKGLKGNYELGDGSWNTRSVKYILTNRTYVGDLQQGKDEILVEDTHEAIIPRSLFLSIQELFYRDTTIKFINSAAPSASNPLRGKVICGSCGGKMQRRKGSSSAGWFFFSCITNNRKGSGCSTGMYIRESEIMDTIKKTLAIKGICKSNVTKGELGVIIEDNLAKVIIHSDSHIDVKLRI